MSNVNHQSIPSVTRPVIRDPEMLEATFRVSAENLIAKIDRLNVGNDVSQLISRLPHETEIVYPPSDAELA